MWRADLMEHLRAPLPDNSPATRADPYGLCTYELLPNARSFLADLHSELATAISSVDMQFYTFECDAVGRPIAEQLMEVRGDGVRTRLMVDNYINLAHNDRYIHVPRRDRQLQRSLVEEWRATNQLLEQMRHAGVGVRMTNPLGFLYRKALRRDHRKLIIIDGDIPEKAVAYLGAINPSEHNAAWNDYMVKLRGDMIPHLMKDYELTWADQNRGGLHYYSDGLVLAEAFGASTVIPVAARLIRQARRRIVLESAYLWGSVMLDALAAATRHAEVSVIVPLHNHKRICTLSERKLDKLVSAGINVWRLNTPDGMTHARGMVVDDYGLFGSNAFNGFLAGIMGELNMVTDNSSLVGQLDDFLTYDIRRSIPHSR